MGNLIMTFFIAMVPIAELRAAIPFAVANDINPFSYRQYGAGTIHHHIYKAHI